MEIITLWVDQKSFIQMDKFEKFLVEEKYTQLLVKMDGGSCTCAGSVGTDGCGQYRPFYAAYSSSLGANWSRPRPLSGTGCVRPRLLSLGPGAPMLLSGGRLCHATGPKELFLW